MELYNEIMELFGSCQPHNIALAEQLVEGQKIDKMQFLEYFGLVELMGTVCAWDSFIKTCNNSEVFVWTAGRCELSALNCLTGLRSLKWGGIDRPAPPIDLSSIAEIKSLQKIRLWYNTYHYPEPILGAANEIDLSPLANLTNLRELNIEGMNVSDVSVVAKLPNLYKLNISGCCRIKSFKPLAEMGANSSLTKHITYSVPFPTAGRKLYRQIAFYDYLEKLLNRKSALFSLAKRSDEDSRDYYKFPHRIANRPKCKNSNTLNTK